MRVLFAILLLVATPALAQRPPTPAGTATPVLGTDHGTTKGLYDSAPEWGLGVQLGTRGASGVAVQKMAYNDGAFDIGLGFGGGAVSLYGDFLYFLDPHFQIAALPESGGYNQTRGAVMPYFGGGLMITHGVALRIPVGVQYTMLRDPINFYAGGVAAYGLIDADKIEFRAQGLLGVRVLL